MDYTWYYVDDYTPIEQDGKIVGYAKDVEEE